MNRNGTFQAKELQCNDGENKTLVAVLFLEEGEGIRLG